MYRRIALLSAALCLPLLSFAGPAHAAGGTVTVTNGGINYPLGDNNVVVSVCHAHATPGPGEIAVATSVRCTINGNSSPTITLPGGDAVVVHANAASRPVTVCAYGQATFSPTVGAMYTSSSSRCWVL